MQFEPLRWLRGSHAQTVFGTLLRPGPRLPLRRERWELPDGDFLDVDRLEGPAAAPLLLVLHGLEGSSSSHYVRGLLAQARKFPGVAQARVRSARTLFEFDEALTGPVHGFAGAEDYWARSSSGPFVARVRVPLLLLSAEDDPFIPATCLPREAAAANPCVTLETHPRGGHLGFVAGPYVPWFWAEWRVAEFLATHL